LKKTLCQESVPKVQFVQWVQKVLGFSSADVGVFTNHQGERKWVNSLRWFKVGSIFQKISNLF
jgi:hypothetical protein